MGCDAIFAIPGTLDAPTGGYAYDREVLRRIGAHGVKLQHLALPGRYPHPSADDLAATARAFASCTAGGVFLIDGLALGAMDEKTIAAVPGPIVALVHHPLAYETGLAAKRREALFQSERSALERAVAVVVTSEGTRNLLVQHYDVPADRITVAMPGTKRKARALGTGRPVQLLSVGAVSQRKAYRDMVAALAELADLNWRLTIVGSLTLDPEEVAHLRSAIDFSGLTSQIELAGAVDDKDLDDAYARADVFVMSSRFEGFGMVLTEAMARGLPIVTTKVGSAMEIIPDAAAMMVEPGDIAGLKSALRTVIVDQTIRTSLALHAWQAAASLPDWDDTAGFIAQVLIEASS